MNNTFARLMGSASEDRHIDALRIVLEMGIHSVDVEEGSLLIHDTLTQDLVFLMTGGDMLSESTLKGQRVRIGEGLTGLAAKTGAVQVGAPVLKTVSQPAHHQYKAPTQIIAAPMFAADAVIGVLTAASYVPERRFSKDEAVLFERMASLAGLIVAQRRQSRSGDEPLYGLTTPRAGSREIEWW